MKKIFWILFAIVILILISVGYHKSLNSNDIGSGDNINDSLDNQIQNLPTSGEKEVLVENDTKELEKDTNKNEEQNQVVKDDDSKVSGETQTEKVETMAGAYSSYDNTKNAWGFVRKSDAKTPEFYGPYTKILDEYEGIYIGNTDEPVIYLTFDEGYENGYTGKILDVLKEKDVTAVFFVTMPYVKQNPELIQRMVDEGMIIGNHTVNHPSMPEVTDDAKLAKEIMDLHNYMLENYNYEMKYLRPPKGEFSERTVKLSLDLGYRTVLWSSAYDDWDRNNQKGTDYAKKMIYNNLHNGSVILLHAVSKDNAEVLADAIDEIRNRGYELASLDEFKR